MKIKTLASAITIAALTACGGGDIVLDAEDNSVSTDNSTNDNSVTNSGGGDGGSGVTNPCASYTDEAGVLQQGSQEGNNCRYTSQFVSSSNEILTNVTFNALDNGGAHIFNESLYIGENFDSLAEAAAEGITQGGDGPTLFIGAGAILAFQEQRALVINRGSQIRAEGSLEAPITITSETDVDGMVTPEDVEEWGGMVVNGFGFTNSCTYEDGWNFQPNIDNSNPLTLVANTDCSVPVEGLIGSDQSNYGGALPEDDSGLINYVVLKHAGSALSPGNELNGITFGSVGSQTTISNLEIYSNIDDGIEFFGGGADVTNYVAVYVQDDSIDLDAGYYGTITNALVIQGGGIDAATGSRTGAHCVESDGATGDDVTRNFDADYLGRATINNLTCISSAKNTNTAGNGDPGAGVNFEEGHLISLNNSIITTAYLADAAADNFNYCFQAEDGIDATQIAAGLILFDGNIFACADLTANGGETPLDLSAVDTMSDQYVEALTRRLTDDDDNDIAPGPFNGTGEAFLTDSGNVLTINHPNDGSIRPDEGTTLNILNGFISVPVAEMRVNGVALPDGFTQPGSTFTEADLAWTFGLIEGARSQPLWFEDGQMPTED